MILHRAFPTAMFYVKRMMFACHLILQRTKIQPVDFECKVLACNALAENTSEHDMQLLSREEIDAMKLVLRMDEELNCYKYYG